jgi:hypothetical protein
MNPNIRIKGLVKFVIGMVVTVILVYLLLWLNAREYPFTRWGLILVGIPGAFGLAGLIEWIAGIPFMELSKKWDSLAGWQRGVFGLSIVFLFFILLIGLISLWDFMGL